MKFITLKEGNGYEIAININAITSIISNNQRLTTIFTLDGNHVDIQMTFDEVCDLIKSELEGTKL